jgi:UrcA family protein
MKTMNRTLSAIAALAMTAGTLALAAPAQAAPADDIVSISLDGLDAANPADAARIDRRIRSAAQDVCGSKLIQPGRLRAQAQACETALTADAHSAVQVAAARNSTPFRLALRVR